MWALFWRLYAAHLSVDFPLQTPLMLEQKGQIRGVIIHSFLVFATSVIVVMPAAFYRPMLLIMALLIAIAHFLIDWLKTVTGDVSARIGLLLFIVDQAVHAGVILLSAAVFGWGYYYGEPGVFARLSLAIFAVWGAPIVIYIVKQAVRNQTEVGIYRERFAKLAILERALLFLGLSMRSLPLIIGCVVCAIAIRVWLLLNEEKVPIPAWEWLIVIASASVGRYLAFGALI